MLDMRQSDTQEEKDQGQAGVDKMHLDKYRLQITNEAFCG
jgi:hypothetical protein